MPLVSATSDPRLAHATTLDQIDRQILHALRCSPRASYAVIGEVLGLSEQTVARRYKRMRGQRVLRIIGLVNPVALGRTAWMVRARCRPDAASALADALVARPEVSYVSIIAGGAEILCSVGAHGLDRGEDLLLQRLPRTLQVLDLSAAAVLHVFPGDWDGFDDPLDATQRAALTALERPVAPQSIEAADLPLLEALEVDGRASIVELARVTGWPPARVARRIAGLRSSEQLRFDLDLAPETLGFHSNAMLWLRVHPGEIDTVGNAIINQPETAFCAAVTGAAALAVAVVCRDPESLYRYVTAGVGTLAGVQQVDVMPIIRRLKQAGSVMDGPRVLPAR
jgi:DNA-binding Lrp family transcriptional regulator